MTASLVFGLITVLGVGPVQEAPDVRIDPRALHRRVGPVDGFQRPLFDPPTVDAEGPAAALPQVKVVCGMTVVQGDTRIDPKMPRQHPREDTEFTMHVRTPSLCWE
jgi:hypothetical protein